MNHARLHSPLGDILLHFDDDALWGLYFDGQKHQPAAIAQARRDDAHPVARSTGLWLERYFAGERTQTTPPLQLHGTPFQRKVRAALARIEYGRTSTYRSIAHAAGSPAAVRAVGAAVGRNPVSIIVPCHRVLGSDGSLTGYAGGLPRKTHLLTLEGVLPPGLPGIH
ncbi:MAG: methylated-DNA--[protein]-cysteine S-methyltransferase [Burkholderiales bacterium]|nr:methylated-DNA--[protein]-cysteine S-methyltransferase [Burkholderiales bacterium]